MPGIDPAALCHISRRETQRKFWSYVLCCALCVPGTGRSSVEPLPDHGRVTGPEQFLPTREFCELTKTWCDGVPGQVTSVTAPSVPQLW